MNLPNCDDDVQSGSEKVETVTTNVRGTPPATVKVDEPKSKEMPSILQDLTGPTTLKQQIKIEPDLHIDDSNTNSSKIGNVPEARINVQPSLKTATTQISATAPSLPKVITISKPSINASNLLVNAATGKRFIKCIDKTGKVSLIEMVTDSNNPKVVKMVLPPALRTTPLQPSSTDPKIKILSPPTQLVSPKASTATGVPTNAIRMPIIVSKSRESSPLVKSVNKTVILSNGKVVFIDKSAASITKPPVQQSLLRPQISLLKPQKSEEKPPPAPIPMAAKGLKMITVNNLSGMENRNINVFMPTECESDSDIEIPRNKRFVVNVKRRRQLAHDLETEFHRCQHFTNVTASVVWLLKRLPLITPMANRQDYTESFPFVVESVEAFEAMPTPKQRCYEVS